MPTMQLPRFASHPGLAFSTLAQTLSKPYPVYSRPPRNNANDVKSDESTGLLSERSGDRFYNTVSHTVIMPC